MKNKIFFLTLAVFTLYFSFGQVSEKITSQQIRQNTGNKFFLKWKGIISEKISDEQTFRYLYFDGASVDDDFLPEFQHIEFLKSIPEKTEVTISNEVYEDLSPEEISILKNSERITDKININYRISFYRKKPQLLVTFIPLRKNSGRYEKLVSFNLAVKVSGSAKKSPAGRTYAANSVLASGNWYKIGVTKDGIYKITYSFLQQIGLDLNSFDPQNIRIYGNGGAMLPFQNWQLRYDDIQENAIYVSGESDGKFDAGDYILFYGQNPHRWIFDTNDLLFKHQQHLYSDTNFYFLTVDLGAGKRIATQPPLTSFTQTVSSFNDCDFYEKDLINPIRSGREWLGETFNIVTEYDFLFSFPNMESLATLRTKVAGRTTSGQNTFYISANGQSLGSVSIGAVSGGFTDTYALAAESKTSFTSSSSNLNIKISMNKGSSGAQGWLDFIEVNVRRKLILTGGQILFRDINSLGNGNAKFQITNTTANTMAWDITNPVETKNIAGTFSVGIFEFIASVDSLREYAAFDATTALLTPVFKEKILNQNLHALPFANLIIVYNKLFEKEAKELAEFHQTNDGLSVVTANTSEIFNEFSSGKQDVTAIKDFAKMFYDKAGTDTTLMPKYLLLFGDGSYDNKNRISGNTNFIPTYQSFNSLSPTASYTSDDYFGLLEDSESESEYDGIDLGIGRLVVKNNTEAQNAVNKIKHYYDKQTMRPWRNYLTFIGDDEDSNIHMDQADSIANIVDVKYKKYNLDKIFLDAYKQQVNAGGQRYPDVNNAINRRMDLGTLMLTWIGHGGELGWAHERILEVSQINKWTNFDNMPLFITATCEFSRFDDPQRTAAGEFVFLNPNGGGIGLLSTTRLVYSSPNFELMRVFTNVAFDEINTGMPRLGDLVLTIKINGPQNINTRNFTLLGDPALRLAYPRYDVQTTFVSDTMKALRKITVKGYVADDSGQKMSNFNGVVYPLVFDKPATINTLNNDGNGVFTFKSQKNILFKGKASAKNGDFEFSFVVPKDISYDYGSGKISHYAENGETDASGYYNNFIIGGSDSTAAADNTGPQIQIYLNDEKFVFGGITDENPKLLAKLFDENGINTAGNGIGHDIVAVLDENTSKAILLNDYYESELDSYQKGIVRYPLSELAEGKHTLRLKAFDVYNNSGEANTEFIVAKSAELALEHVLNYPNPFTTNTAFYFEHNQPGQNLDIQIQIFTVSGKLIKTIDNYVYADSFRAGPFYWNGLDDYGDKIGKGVYIYKLKVTAPSGKTVNKYERLVILN